MGIHRKERLWYIALIMFISTCDEYEYFFTSFLFLNFMFGV